jgi:hypothetical protein
LNDVLYRNRWSRFFAYNWIPFYRLPEASASQLSAEAVLELERSITFDALTPRHDHPMSSRTFRSILISEGFRIDHIFDPPTSPMYATAVRVRPRSSASTD